MEIYNFVNNLWIISPIAELVIIWFITGTMGHLSDINNQAANLNLLSPKKRLDAILNHPTPLKLVRSMPAQELLMTIRQLGLESSLELIELMHPKQVQELFDLEIWTNDHLNLDVAGRYFTVLFEASPDSAIAQIHHLDIEFLGLMFKSVAEIYDTSLNEEPEDFPDLYSTSPDGRFIVCFHPTKESSELAESLHTFLQELYGRDLPYVLRLLESLRYELPSLLEETCLRWRQNRLLEMGILPREERLQFFAPVAQADIKRLLANQKPLTHIPQEDSLGLTTFKTDINDNYAFLKSALSLCSDDLKQLFWLRLRHAVINMHASLSGDFGDTDAIVQSSEYVKFLAELGLMQLCQGDLKKGGAIIETTLPIYLIRLGRTTLVGMRKRLKTALTDTKALFGQDFCYADSPLHEMARALCLPEPRYYEGLLDSKKLTVRYFLSLTELNATLNAVHELIFRAQFVGSFATEELMHNRKVSHAGMVARALVNQFQGRAHLMADIKSHEASAITAKTGALSQDFTQFARAFGETTAQHMVTTLGLDDEQTKKRAHAFINAILAQLEQNPSLLLG